MLDEKVIALEKWQEALMGWNPPPVMGLPEHRLGVHWIADQIREGDKTYMQRLLPPVIKIVNPSADRVTEAFRWVDPNGHVALRYHPISEQQAELQADPIKLAKEHAAYWINQFNTTYRNFDRKRLPVMGINEPTVHNAAQARGVAKYTEVFLQELQPHKISAYVFNFSVGWPREEQGKIIWDEFLYLENLINATGSYGCVHEYWYPKVSTGWNSYANRVSRCPMRIKFIIGECGYTRQLVELPQPWGWNGNVSAGTYADMLWEYATLVDPDRVFAVLPFTTSFGGSEWASKDTAPAHNEILARRKKFSWPAPWPKFGTVPPDPEPEPETMYNLVWPKMPRITQWYGHPHSGLDIAMVTRTPLYAMWNGVVAFEGVDDAPNGGYGKYIRISHPELGFDCFFAHCDEVLLKAGNTVKRGQLVAYSGNTGNSTGPHLHWEIRLRIKVGNGLGAYRTGVGPFSRGQVDPLAVVWALDALFGHEEK